MDNINICKSHYNEQVKSIHNTILKNLINNKSYFLNIDESNSVSYDIEDSIGSKSDDYDNFNNKHKELVIANEISDDVIVYKKYIIDIASYHLKSLNIVGINNYYIEFVLRNANLPHKFNIYQNEITPLLSCILFLNTNKLTPFVFTNVDIETYKYKDFENNNEFVICYPDSTNIISYNNKYYNGYINTNQEMLSTNNNFLEIKIWHKYPQNNLESSILNIIEFEKYKNIYETVLFKDITHEIQKVNFYNYVTNFDHLNDFIYNKRFYHFYKFHRILYNQAGSIFRCRFNEKDDINYKQIIEDVNNINKLSFNHNRFIQRFTFKNIIDSLSSNIIIKYIQKLYSDLSTFPDSGIILNDSTNVFKLCLNSIIPILDNVKILYNLQDSCININKLYLIKRSHEFYHLSSINNSLFSVYLHINHSISTEGEYFFQDGLSSKLDKGDAIIFSNLNTDYSILPVTKGNVYILCCEFDIDI